jgi:hypothetical protein
MNQPLKNILAIVLSGIWVNASEFFRNEVLLKKAWVSHYQSLGLTFPSAPVNAIGWIVWGFTFAGALYLLSRKFSIIQAALIGWLTGFVLMWIVTWNLAVFPLSILPYAIPLSLLEVFIGTLICLKVAPVPKR